MKKRLIFTIAALLIGATMFAQEQTQVQNQSQEKQITKRNRIHQQDGIAIRSEDAIMQKDQKRIRKKVGTGDKIRQRDRANIHQKARPMNRNARSPINQARPVGIQKRIHRGGR